MILPRAGILVAKSSGAILRRHCAVLEGSDPLAGLHELLGTVGSGLIFAEEYALARRLLNGAINSARAASTIHAFSWVDVYGVRPRAASTRCTAPSTVVRGALPSEASATKADALRSDEP